jgi:hypothetical protein
VSSVLLSLAYYLGAKLPVTLIFEGTSDSFSWQLHHFAFPPAVFMGSNFSTPPPALVIACLFDYRHPKWA